MSPWDRACAPCINSCWGCYCPTAPILLPPSPPNSFTTLQTLSESPCTHHHLGCVLLLSCRRPPGARLPRPRLLSQLSRHRAPHQSLQDVDRPRTHPLPASSCHCRQPYRPCLCARGPLLPASAYVRAADPRSPSPDFCGRVRRLQQDPVLQLRGGRLPAVVRWLLPGLALEGRHPLPQEGQPAGEPGVAQGAPTARLPTCGRSPHRLAVGHGVGCTLFVPR